MVEKNIVGKYNIEDEYPVFGYEGEDGGGTPAVSPVASLTRIDGIRSVVSMNDPVEDWRSFSEQLRNRRLAKDQANEGVRPRLNTAAQAYQAQAADSDTYSEQAPDQQFQKDYEQDMVEFTHSPDPRMLGLQRYLAAVNEEIPDEQLRSYETPEHHDEADQPEGAEDDYAVIEPDALKVADVMTKRVVCVLESTTIEQVASICNRRGFSGVPVVNEQKGLIGIVTMRDILHQLLDKGSLSTYAEQGGEVLEQKALAILEDPVRLYMQRNVITVRPESSVREACQLMLKHGIRRLVVARGDLVRGVFSAQDAVRVLAAADLRVDG